MVVIPRVIFSENMQILKNLKITSHNSSHICGENIVPKKSHLTGRWLLDKVEGQRCTLCCFILYLWIMHIMPGRLSHCGMRRDVCCYCNNAMFYELLPHFYICGDENLVHLEFEIQNCSLQGHHIQCAINLRAFVTMVATPPLSDIPTPSPSPSPSLPHSLSPMPFAHNSVQLKGCISDLDRSLLILFP